MPINKDTPMGDVIKDFQKSKAPQFKGKSDEKKREMAIAAKLNTEQFKSWNTEFLGETIELNTQMELDHIVEVLYVLPKALQEEAAEALGLYEKRGLWDNIHAKRKRIKAGSGERMRKPGSKGSPTNQDFKDSQSEETEHDSNVLSETAKLDMLLRLGLVSKNEIVRVRRAMKLHQQGATLTPLYRDILLNLMDKLINVIETDNVIYNQFRRKVQESILPEFEAILTEAGYMDPPKNMKEFRKKYPKLAEKIKSTDSGDFNVAQQTVSEQYTNHLGFVSKK